jgi:hypothetical protein
VPAGIPVAELARVLCVSMMCTAEILLGNR